MASFAYTTEYDKKTGHVEAVKLNEESLLLGKIAEMQKTINELGDEHAKQGKRIEDLIGHHKALNDLIAKK